MSLEKKWVRIILSLFLGGGVSEAIHITTGDPNRPEGTNLSLLYALIIYIILTIIVNRKAKQL